MPLHLRSLLKYSYGVSLLGTIPLTLYPLHDMFVPWLALCSSRAAAAERQAEAAGLGTSTVQLPPLLDALLTTGIMGGCRRQLPWIRGCRGRRAAT